MYVIITILKSRNAILIINKYKIKNMTKQFNKNILIKISTIISLFILSVGSFSFAAGSISITSITDGKDSTGVSTGTSITKNTSASIVVSCTNGDKLTIVDSATDVAKSSEVTCAGGTATLTPTSPLIDGTYKIKSGNTTITSITNGVAAVNMASTSATISIDGHSYTAATAVHQPFNATPKFTPTSLNITSTVSGKSCRTYVVAGSDIYIQLAAPGFEPSLGETFTTGSYAVGSWTDGGNFAAAQFNITVGSGAAATTKNFYYSYGTLNQALTHSTPKVTGSGKTSLSGTNVTVSRDGTCSTPTSASFALNGITYNTSDTGYIPLADGQTTLTITGLGSNAVNTPATKATAIVGGNNFEADTLGATSLNANSPVAIANVGTASTKATITIGSTPFTATTNGTIITYSSAFNVDGTAPTISAVTFSSNNANTSLAKAGDIITAIITYSESVLGNPTSTIMIGGVSRELSFASGQSGSIRIGTYTVVNEDTGVITIPASSISANTITDIAGNSITTSNATAGVGTVSVDNIAPTISSVSISSNNTKNNQYLKAGDIVTANITYSESVLNNPTTNIKIGSTTKAITFSAGQTGATRIGTYTISSTDIGEVQLLDNSVATNTITDLAGNLNITSNATSSNILNIDNISPIIISATAITTNTTYNNYAKAGDRVYVNYTFSEPVSGAATGMIKLGSISKNLTITSTSTEASTTLTGYYIVQDGDDGEFSLPLNGLSSVSDIADNGLSSAVNNSSANVMISSLTNSVETVATDTAKITIGGKTFTATTPGKINSTSTLSSGLSGIINGADIAIASATKAKIVIGSKTYFANNAGVLSGITNASLANTKTNGMSCRTYILQSGNYYVYGSSYIDYQAQAQVAIPIENSFGTQGAQYFLNLNNGSTGVPANGTYSWVANFTVGFTGHANNGATNRQFFYFGTDLDTALTASRGITGELAVAPVNSGNSVKDGECNTPTAEVITVGGQDFTNEHTGYSVAGVNKAIVFTNGVDSFTTPANKAQFDFGGKTFISDDAAGLLNLNNIILTNPTFTITNPGANFVPQVNAVATINNLNFTADNLTTTSLTKSSSVIINDLGTASSRSKVMIGNVPFTADSNGVLDAYLPYNPIIRIDTVAPILSTTTKVSANGSLSALFSFSIDKSFNGEMINVSFSTSTFATSTANCNSIPSIRITSTGASSTINVAASLSAGTYQGCVVRLTDLLDNTSFNQNSTDNYNIDTFSVQQYSSGGGGGGVVSQYIPNNNTTSNKKTKQIYIGDDMTNTDTDTKNNNTNNNTNSNVVTFKKEVKYKSNNKDVKELQKFLNSAGFIISNNGAGSIGRETTYFGRATELSLKKYQKANGLKETGKLDANTRTSINNYSIEYTPLTPSIDAKPTINSTNTSTSNVIIPSNNSTLNTDNNITVTPIITPKSNKSQPVNNIINI